MEWLRWHHGTCTDPKWRVIARKSGQPIPVVLAVWAMMLESASQSSERGRLSGWDSEDIAAALDVDAAEIDAIHQAMQGKVLDGDALTGWDKRQPKRERDQPDNSADRVRQHRERKRQEAEGNAGETPVTPCNAGNGSDEIREEKKESPHTPQGADEPFDRFWRAFPKRLGSNPRADAKKRFDRACRAGADPEDIIGAARRYYGEEESLGHIGTPYVSQAVTWLNKRRWEDYAIPDPPESEADWPAAKAMLSDETAEVGPLIQIRDAEGWEAAERYAQQHHRRTA